MKERQTFSSFFGIGDNLVLELTSCSFIATFNCIILAENINIVLKNYINVILYFSIYVDLIHNETSKNFQLFLLNFAGKLT